jgi:ribokinase
VVYAVNYRPGSWREGLEEMRRVQHEALACAEVAVMNQEEYELLAGPEEDFPAPDLLVVTRGEEGGWYRQAGQTNDFTAPPVQVQYDVGAGDTFHAALVAALLGGGETAALVEFAAACAALKISRPASAPPPSREEVLTFLHQSSS